MGFHCVSPPREATVLRHGRELRDPPEEPAHPHGALQLPIL